MVERLDQHVLEHSRREDAALLAGVAANLLNNFRYLGVRHTDNGSSRVKSCYEQREKVRPYKKRSTDKFLHGDELPFVEIGEVADIYDIVNLRYLSECIYDHDSSLFKKRFFGYSDDAFDGGGAGTSAVNLFGQPILAAELSQDMNNYKLSGNNCTYMGHHLKELMPDFLGRVIASADIASEYAGWAVRPSSLALRCVEYLEYEPGNHLNWHNDGDSVYTVSVMMADPLDFDGGEFVIKDYDEQTYSSVSRPPGWGIMFDSESIHGVKPVSRGKRVVFVMEFWMHGETDLIDRPSAPP